MGEFCFIGWGETVVGLEFVVDLRLNSAIRIVSKSTHCVSKYHIYLPLIKILALILV